MDETELIREAMRLLGKRTSERKKISSRINGSRPKRKRTKSKPIAQAMPTDLKQ
jgi:hypothetical protein